jgi:hypothetical protein
MELIRRLVILVLATVLAGTLAVTAIYVQSIPVQAGQSRAAALLGTDSSKYCANLSQVNDESVALDGKIVVLKAIDSTVYADYQNALHANRQPSSSAEVTGIVCLSESQAVYHTATYGNHTYSCTQYQTVLDAYLVDKRSIQVVAYRQFKGPRPPDCPDSTEASLTETGAPVIPALIADWLD